MEKFLPRPIELFSRPVLRTAGRPRRPTAAGGRALHADVARLCPPPRWRGLAGESALDSAEVIGSLLLEAAGCTSGQGGLGSRSRPEQSCRTDNLVALHSTAIMSSRRARQGLFDPRGSGEGVAVQPLAIVARV